MPFNCMSLQVITSGETLATVFAAVCLLLLPGVNF